jgi:hypothetical protein
MSNRTRGDSGEYEFTRAAYDELQDAEKKYGVSFELTTAPTSQRGVWALTITAKATERVEGLAYITTWKGSWPNSVAISYAAFLYQACHRTVRMVEAWYIDCQAHLAPQTEG